MRTLIVRSFTPTWLYIGNILRSCDVKRGIGTIRQDVNLSIRDENRVEMKGVQDMKIFVKTIENEILRQKKLSDSKKPTQAEVRNALLDATSEFLRPMPGAARMYPETDLPLLRVKKSFIDNLKKNLPKLSSELEKELRSYGIHKELIKLILSSNKIEEFKELIRIIKNPPFVAKILVLYPKELISKGNLSKETAEDIFNKDVFVRILEEVKKKKITERQVKDVLERIANGASINEALRFEEYNPNEIEEKIMKVIKEKPGLSENAYMGLIMKDFKGKVDGKKIMKIIKKFVV